MTLIEQVEFLMTILKQTKLNIIQTDKQLKYLHYQVVNYKNMSI